MCERKRSWPNLNYYFGIYWIDCEEKSKHFVRVDGPLLELKWAPERYKSKALKLEPN